MTGKTHRDLFLESCIEAAKHYKQHYGIDTTQEQERHERMFMERYGMARLYEKLKAETETNQIVDQHGIFTQQALLARVAAIRVEIEQEWGFRRPRSVLTLINEDIDVIRNYSLWLACFTLDAFIRQSHA